MINSRDEFVEHTKALTVGDPLDEKSKQGAIVSEIHFKKIMGCIETAKNEGGKDPLRRQVQSGWTAVARMDILLSRQSLKILVRTCRTNQEEIFGPVVTFNRFSNEEEAIALANATSYGLAASIWTQDISRANRVAAKVESGIIWINCWLLTRSANSIWRNEK